ncbi:small membrane protein YdgU [Serratia ficaria]
MFFHRGFPSMLRRYLFEIILAALILCGLIAACFYL